jgi:hypothetical protein
VISRILNRPDGSRNATCVLGRIHDAIAQSKTAILSGSVSAVTRRPWVPSGGNITASDPSEGVVVSQRRWSGEFAARMLGTFPTGARTPAALGPAQPSAAASSSCRLLRATFIARGPPACRVTLLHTPHLRRRCSYLAVNIL